MTREEFDNNIENLKSASEYYYKTENTIMTDNEYDILINKCREYDKQNNLKNDFLNKSIGFEINGKPVIKHIKRMYSQKDIFTLEDTLDWVNRKKTKTFYLEPKLDGCSCNLLYINGKLKSIATRGDGFIGQDITFLKEGIIGIPLTIDILEQIEIRGELVISYTNFNKFKDSFKNPRNFVSGSLSLLDVDEFKKRSIEFIPWGLGFTKRKMNKSEVKPFLTKLGFTPMPCTKTSSELTDINKTYKRFIKASRENNNSELDYPIDGLMVYINKHEEQSFYGYGSRFPLYSIAFKLPAKEVSTKLIDVEYNIGRNGQLSIVGIIEPVELLGSTVSRANLHNLNYIKNKDIKIKDKVIVYKAGDIVPAIKESFKDIRDGTEKNINITKCPYCKNKLENNSCINKDCKGILASKLKFAVSKHCFNLQGIGDEFINKILSSWSHPSIVKFFDLDSTSIVSYLRPNLYKLMDKDFNKVIITGRYKKDIQMAANYEKVLKTIKDKPFNLLLLSLSIPGLGNAKINGFIKLGLTDIDLLLDYLKVHGTKGNTELLIQLTDDIVNFLRLHKKDKI